MIVAEHRIKEIVASIPAIRLNDDFTLKPQFSWGSKKELNRWLQEKKDAAYPLIWLMPSKDDYSNSGKLLTKECTLIIATREAKKDLFNEERYIKSFDVVLNPLATYLTDGFILSSTTESPEDWEIEKYPNYSESDKNATIDLWDALTLKINVTFNDNCFNPIYYGY